jgi:hypothetical protein
MATRKVINKENVANKDIAAAPSSTVEEYLHQVSLAFKSAPSREPRAGPK